MDSAALDLTIGSSSFNSEVKASVIVDMGTKSNFLLFPFLLSSFFFLLSSFFFFLFSFFFFLFSFFFFLFFFFKIKEKRHLQPQT